MYNNEIFNRKEYQRTEMIIYDVYYRKFDPYTGSMVAEEYKGTIKVEANTKPLELEKSIREKYGEPPEGYSINYHMI